MVWPLADPGNPSLPQSREGAASGAPSSGDGRPPGSLMPYFMALLLLVLLPARNGIKPSGTSGRAKDVGEMASPSTASDLLAGFFQHDLRGGTCAAVAKEDPRRGYRIRSIVATLPDPFASGLAYNFDRYLSAIERAMADTGYVLDRGFLPWAQSLPDDAAGAGGKAPAKPSAFLGRAGALLFRSDEKELILLHVVGESPLEGLDATGFASALREANTLPDGFCEEGAPDSLREVKILGPSFSGSATSLLFALRSDAKRPFRVVSGAATAVDPQPFQELGGTFRATVPPDSESTDAFFRYLEHGLGIGPRRVALLVEESTSYGQGQLQKDGSGGAASWRSEALFIPFPLHISQVRTALAAQPPSTESLPLTSSRQLPLSLEPDGPPPSHATTFSRLAPPSIDLLLARLLSAIDSRIYYVGLFATDVRDKIFLSRQVRENRPDVNLFTFGADLLYGHPDAANVMRGTLVVSPYSLFATEAPWTFHAASPRRTLVQFASSPTQGVYNAALALLERTDRLVEYGFPFVSKVPEGEHLVRRPPTWVTVVGYGGLWPVTTLGWADYDQDHGYLVMDQVASNPTEPIVHEKEADKAESLPRRVVLAPQPAALPRRSGDQARMVLYGTFLASFLGVIAFALAPSLLPRPLDGLIPRAARTTGPTMKRFGFVPRLLMLSAATFLLCQYAMLRICLPISNGILGRSFAAQVRRGADDLLGVVVGAAWIGSLVAALLCWRSMRQILRRWGLTGLVTPLIVCSVSGSLILVTARWALDLRASRPPKVEGVTKGSLAIERLTQITEGDLAFLRLRATALGSGVNPIVPFWILTTIGVYWTLMTMHRYRLLEAFDCRHPFLNLLGPGFSGVRKLEVRLHRHLGGGLWRSPTPWLASVILGGLAAFLFYKYGIAGFDGARFKTLYACVFVSAYLGIVITCTRMLVIWGDLRELLRLLAGHPFLAAFSRVPRHLAWEPMLQLSGTLPRFADTAVAVQYGLRSSVALGPSAGPLREAAELGERHLHRAEAAFGKGAWDEAIAERSRAQQALGRCARLLSLALAPCWRRGVVPEVATEGETMLAIRVLGFVRHVFAQLRCFLIFLVIAVVGILFATAAYPFQPKHLMLRLNILILAFVVFSILSVLVGIDRDVILSRVANSEAQRVTWNREFVGRLLVYVAVPLLSFVATQFPELGSLLRGSLDAFRGR